MPSSGSTTQHGGASGSPRSVASGGLRLAGFFADKSVTGKAVGQYLADRRLRTQIGVGDQIFGRLFFDHQVIPPAHQLAGPGPRRGDRDAEMFLIHPAFIPFPDA